MHRIKLLQLLRCPEDQSELTLASEEMVGRINDAIRAGKLHNCGGHLVETSFEAGLLRHAGDVIYPVVHGIPLLLRDDGVVVSQIPS